MAEEKKIIIDEDWKSRVEAEKKQAAGQPSTGDDTGPSAGGTPPEDVPMPPASFGLLLTTLATEALMAMGQLPHPMTGQTQKHRHQARYLIDTIDMLREKTKGNLTEQEQEMLDTLLHQLRMAFIAVDT
jgi:hypothetical protein